MRILFVAVSYPPDTRPGDNRFFNLAVQLQRLGHEVSILNASPNHPSMDVFHEFEVQAEGYRGKIRIIRTWVTHAKKDSFLPRFFGNLSFLLSSALFGAWKTGPIDIVLSQSPPLFGGLTGFIVARLRSARFVLNVSDLWPQALIDLGLVRNRTAIRIAVSLEEFLYRKADLIIGLSHYTVENIAKRMPAKRVMLSSGGANVRQYEVREKSSQRVDGNGDFIVGFAGLHGPVQALDNVLRAAGILSGNPRIKFRFYGHGPDKPSLLKLRDELGLAQVEFYDPQPKSRMPEILAAFDVAIVPLREGGVFRGTLPAKMLEAMAAGLPIVLSASGEARRMIEDADAGICVVPENSEAMARAIADLFQNPALARRLGLNGRRYAIEHLDWESIAKALEHELTLEEGSEPPRR